MQINTVRACVSPETINRVGRLFNNTLPDVLNELFQNARRAKATRLSVKLRRADQVVLSICDNGMGIADPRSVLTLGHSDWDAEIAKREDPAGMGMFSLAGHDISITSRHADNPHAWCLSIPAHAWDGSADIPVEQAGNLVGTTIDIILPQEWDDHVERLVSAAALHYPLSVTFNGEECASADWLADTIDISEWNGCRIGVFAGRCCGGPSLNFNGLQIACKLPTIAEAHPGTMFYAKVDILDCPALQLVLPARKEAVANAALGELRVAVERAIFKAIGRRPSHKLGFDSWSRAAEIGVVLAEAEPILGTWNPSIADSSSFYDLSRPLAASEAILVEPHDPDVEQCVARALKDSPLRARLAEERREYAGYSWYDRLPRLGNFRFDIEHAGGNYTVTSAIAEPMPEAHLKATAITLRADLAEGTSIIDVSQPTDFALVTDQLIWDGLDAARIVYLDTLPSDDLIDLLDRVYFSPCDDSDSDSWDTQHRRFEADARDEAIKLLRGADEAICDQFRCLLRDHRWLLPKGVRLELSVDGDTINVVLERIPEDAA